MGKSFFLNVIKGALFSLFISVVAILIFAGIISSTNFSGTTVKTVNQFIKIISVFLGCFFSLKENMGAVKGLLTAAIYVVLLYLLFTLLGENAFNLSFLIDLLFCSVIGLLSGIITINVKQK